MPIARHLTDVELVIICYSALSTRPMQTELSLFAMKYKNWNALVGVAIFPPSLLQVKVSYWLSLNHKLIFIPTSKNMGINMNEKLLINISSFW